MGKIVLNWTLSRLSNWIRYSILALLLILLSVRLTMALMQVATLMKAEKILVKLLSQFLVQVTVQPVQNDIKLHHVTVAVHVLHTGINFLSAPQLSLVSSELHPAC